jgi:hypothetical protein
VIKTLEYLAERYPNISLGLLLANAIADAGDLSYLADSRLLLELERLRVSYSQFEAAGLLRRGK